MVIIDKLANVDKEEKITCYGAFASSYVPMQVYKYV